MNGLPWTSEKIAEAASQTRHGGSVGFAFGFETLSRLLELDARIFSIRPDLKLVVWTVADSGSYSDEELETLASLLNVRRLGINVTARQKQSLIPLARMTALNALELGARASVDLGFLSSLRQLHELRLSGKFTALDAAADCPALQKIYISATLTSYTALAGIRSLRSLTLDTCAAPLDFSPLNQPTLEYLHLSGIHKLDTVDSLAGFSHLQTLTMRAPHLEKLPDLSGLHALRNLKLDGMKKWGNPEILQTLPNLNTLELAEINTKLTAEHFAFLTSMPNLTKVDFRFIDSGKRRRTQIEALFRQASRLDIVVPYDDPA